MSQVESTDFLIIGAGVAGLRAAIELADSGQVLIITKEALGESNTHYAQGGIAVALSGEEDVALHLEDTLYAGDGLVYRPAAEALVSEGPLRVEELIHWGTKFDRAQATSGSANSSANLDPLGDLLLGREAAHSLPRILHANGDATGAEISRALLAHARQHPNITIADWTMATQLLLHDGRIIGADLLSSAETAQPHLRHIHARAVLLASGGAGQVYSDTTNPAVATGDGIYLASEAGAELADMEFYQFHPTALSLSGVPRFLLSEALRGEGAWLVNARGERFMHRYHPLLELAPRDVVARAIAREGLSESLHPLPVYLDLRHVQIDLVQRFPGISRFLAQHGLSLRNDLIPVRPAAHYLMGGVRTDLDGRTTLPGLYAAGEVACTGVHGANRLASNSLLEGLVFGARAAQAILADGPSSNLSDPHHDSEMREGLPQAPSLTNPDAPSITRSLRHGWESTTLNQDTTTKPISELITDLRTAMFRCAGLLRDAASLRAGQEAVATIQSQLDRDPQALITRDLMESRALASVAQSILRAALARTESRGAHFRNDHPHRDDEHFLKHSIDRQGQIHFESW